MHVDQIDAIEISEAFAATPLVSTLLLGDGDEGRTERIRRITNRNGGSVAIGHPMGASGTRIVATLIDQLRSRSGGIGIAAIRSGERRVGEEGVSPGRFRGATDTQKKK